MQERIKERLLIGNLIFGFLVLTIFISWFFLPKTHVKVGYVRISVVLEKFMGTREAQRKLEGKINSWKTNGDSLKKNFDKFLDSLQRANKGKEPTKEDKILLQRKQIELENYLQVAQQNAQNEEQKTMDGVYKQINSFVEQFARDYGYDLILGTTPDGSLMYGHKTLDITEDVIDALNKQYRK
jgi:outer membrane protein